ncbi:5-methyltetrahydropteroyltriglutamate--homocysteine S-methyltransferase [Dysgonomonas sp. BGC7]|uniref:5-methyltetrahydropteroyltriglutamate-- homocysteine S-methyltransferase n=1 Tax=Dysgonomonas sp. BGC7 TaxID=1658008 RepID=UPI000680C267|nr:5-methyltetrahydropteroyltriglutamate--homocysteine S-methyltransferase [Dysgonomonas sp. BGC7]MBD8388908.1 5-methyltetrahydropteroyltriglutamate--homocysteine S-methyltransferase [Dysgonomonas sp. BGC7]
MKTNILGYPRIGSHRELKKACENFWSGKISKEQLLKEGASIRALNWYLQKEYKIDLIPSNDFSFYDQVLDLAMSLGAIPKRYTPLLNNKIELYFAMARGYQKNGCDIIAMEMTKWFDTNYHYIVPEFTKEQQFSLFNNKPLEEYKEAKALGIETKPVIIGPISFLLLGKEKELGFDKLDLVEHLIPVYTKILKKLEEAGATTIQIDEPFLAMDINDKVKSLYPTVYKQIKNACPKLEIILTTYFEGLRDNTQLALDLPVDVLHIDLVRCPQQLDSILLSLPANQKLSLGIVDGRNIWKNDFSDSLNTIYKAVNKLGKDRVLIGASSSFLHVPYDLELETKENILTPQIKQWMAFAEQKVKELSALKDLLQESPSEQSKKELEANKKAIQSKQSSSLIHNIEIKKQIKNISVDDSKRQSIFAVRRQKQQGILNLPLFPTTTIGSFPQTKEVRSWRAQFKKGNLSEKEYNDLLRAETQKAIKWQEEIGLDVLVHGEFERNDMVEYFGEQLAGFTFSQNGWVQSYGSRCVKPPIIYGDVSRPDPMSVYWTTYANALTNKPVKGMLTGPITILQWSFVRDDQPRSETCKQIALAIRREVENLEQAGIQVIQIDEPAIREGLPLRKQDWKQYLDWAVNCFCLSASVAKDETQIHTHMCYSEFNDIIEHIALMDADVITIECSRSQMELLDAFAEFKYPNDIGPGVYDIHSPRVPNMEEMVSLMKKAIQVIPSKQLWINPDCGLKTRGWDETKEALVNMVKTAKELRKEF